MEQWLFLSRSLKDNQNLPRLWSGRTEGIFAASRGDHAIKFGNLPPFEGFDNDLLQRVTCFLNQEGHLPFQSLEVTVDQGVVLVRGRVPTFYLRQVAIAWIKWGRCAECDGGHYP